MAHLLDTLPKTANRETLAMGLFDRPVAIQSALRDLANNGFGELEYFVAMASEATDFAGDFAGGSGAIGVTVCQIDAAADGGIPGWLDRLLPGSMHESAATAALDRHTERLERHIRGGGAVMLVRTSEPVTQQSICSILLHYASDGVVTHQIRSARAPQMAPAY